MNVQNGSALLLALQYTDSAFPAGGFAHSWGLETGVAAKALRTVAELEAACRAALRHQVARTDAVAAAGCCNARLARIIAIDRRLTATRAARETREASLRTGRRLLEVATANEGTSLQIELHAAVRGGTADGNHASVLGAVAGYGGLAP